MRTLAIGAVFLALGVISRPTSAEDLPEVKSKSVVVLDAETGAELFAHGADEVRPEHLEVAQHCLWDSPEEQPQKVAPLVFGNIAW